MKTKQCLLLVAAFFAAQAYATIPGLFVASSSPSADPDANGDTVNVWGPTSGNVFIGNSADNGGGSAAGAGNPAWGLYSGTTDGVAEMFHSLNGALAVGQTLSIDFDNGWVDSPGVVGLALQDGFGANLFELLFLGGGSNYTLNDSALGVDTGVGFTADGLNVAVTLDDALGGYTVDIGGTVLASRTLANLNPVTTVRVFNFQAGNSANHNLYANNLQIIPEPSAALLLLVGALGLTRIARRKAA